MEPGPMLHGFDRSIDPYTYLSIHPIHLTMESSPRLPLPPPFGLGSLSRERERERRERKSAGFFLKIVGGGGEGGRKCEFRVLISKSNRETD